MARVEQGGRRKRRVSDVFLFAVWWFDQKETKADVHAGMPKFKAIMAKAKLLKADGYDLELVKRAILTMRVQGLDVTTPHAVKWRSPERGRDWYAYSLPVQPPIWDGFVSKLGADNMIPLRVS